MALETGTYVSDLVTTNPASGDAVSQADDHLRLVKSVLRTTFPEATAPIYGLRAMTATATTSGTSVDFTSIPSWVKRITVSFSAVSTSGSSPMILQLGDSGGIEASGYLGAATTTQNTVAVSSANFTDGIGLAPGTSNATAYHGLITLVLLNSATNTWVATVNGSISNDSATFNGASSKSLSATLDRIRLTTQAGATTFDAGIMNVLYE